MRRRCWPSTTTRRGRPNGMPARLRRACRRRRLDLSGGPGPRNVAHSSGHAGQPGDVPPPVGAGQDGGHARPPQRRPRRAGHRRRLATSTSTARTASTFRRRPPGGPGRRAAAGHHRPVEPGPVQPRRQGLPAERLPLHAQASAAAAADDPGRRQLYGRAPAPAGGAVRRRVRHQHAVARAVPRDPRATRPRVRGERPRPGQPCGCRRSWRSASAPPSAKSSSIWRRTRRPTRSTCACWTTATTGSSARPTRPRPNSTPWPKPASTAPCSR